MPNVKIFWSGNSQAVRLPKGFRFAPGTDEVSIRRVGESLVLEPIPRQEWPQDFWRAFDGIPEGFERPTQVRQHREELAP
jgi:virulence-associated protein VagC